MASAEKIINYGFQAIRPGFNRESAEKKGKKLCKAEHVLDVQERRIEECATITARVLRQTNISEPPVRINIKLDESRTAVSRQCNCKAGSLGMCKHICAVIRYINEHDGASKTSNAQVWDRPSIPRTHKEMKEKYAKPTKISTLYEQKRPANVKPAAKFELTSEHLRGLDCQLLTTLVEEEKKKKRDSSESLVSDNGRNETVVVPECYDHKSHINDFIIFQETNYFYGVDKNDVLLDEPQQRIFSSRVCVTAEEITNAYCETIQQYQSPFWFDIRYPRVSSSSDGHKIKTRRSKYEELATALLHPKPFSGNRHTAYGLRMEKHAIMKYSSDYNTKVATAGVAIHSLQPWLCGTSDGIVIDDNGNPLKNLEVKCPSSCCSTGIVSEIEQYDDKGGVIKELKINVPYLGITENKTYYLKESTPYYTQCQMLLYVTGLQSCDFYVYSNKNQVLVEVPRNETFLFEVIPKISSFYFDYILPALVKKYDT